jgi:prepilin-type N-terminal cleavage/methylation domain-containing protein
MIPIEDITESSLSKLNRFGMTLIELLIVLGILAVLAGMTLTLVSEMDNTSRQNTTKTKLDQIESAIIGNSEHYSKFINDTGRLPVIVEGENGKQFSELWDNSLFAPAEDINLNHELFDGVFINVTLNVGWKGPYLNVPNGKLYDGFGNDFWIKKNNENNTPQDDDTDTEENEINDEIDDIFWDYHNPNSTDPISIIKFGSLGNDNKLDDPKKPETETEEPRSDWENQDDKREIKSHNFFAILHVKILSRDSSTDQTIWLPPTKTNNNGAGYEKYVTKEHDIGNIVLPPNVTTNSQNPIDLFICCQPTITTAETWSKSQIFSIGNNSFRWLPYSNKFNRLSVAVFSPFVSKEFNTQDLKTAHIKTTTANYNFNSSNWEFTNIVHDGEIENGIEPPTSQTDINEVTFYNLTPGIRKIIAYGCVISNITNTPTEEDGETTKPLRSNSYKSNVQTIELKTGENFITLYLNEPF